MANENGHNQFEGGRLNIIWKAIESKTKLNAEWKSKCNNNKRRTQKQAVQES